MNAPVDVVIVAYNSEATVGAAVDSVRTDPDVGRVLVVDNQSPDASASVAQAHGAEVLSAGANRGFGAGCNLGAAATASPWILFLNPDAEVATGAVRGLRAHLEGHPEVAAVASEVRSPAGLAQPVRRRFPTVRRAPLEPGVSAAWDERWYARRHTKGGAVDWLSAACLLVRRRAFQEVGGFDERFFLYSEDVDLAARLWLAGWQVHWIPGLPCVHRAGSSSAATPGRGKEPWVDGMLRWAELHHPHPRAVQVALAAGLTVRAVAWTLLGERERAAVWRRASARARRHRCATAAAPADRVPTVGSGDRRIRLLGVTIDAITLDQAHGAVAALVDRNRFAQVATINVDFLRQAHDDYRLRTALDRVDLAVADGVPLLWMARWQRTPLPGRVNGTDLVQRLVASAAERSWSVCLLGGDDGVAERAAERLIESGVRVVGARGPRPEVMDDPVMGTAVAEWVRSTGAQLLLLAIGGGRQETWIAGHRHRLGPCVAIGVGSALDYLAGTRRRAPVWMQHYGLEWAWRLGSEPGRLWRRYLVDDPVVFVRFARERLAGEGGTGLWPR